MIAPMMLWVILILAVGPRSRWRMNQAWASPQGEQGYQERMASKKQERVVSRQPRRQKTSEDAGCDAYDAQRAQGQHQHGPALALQSRPGNQTVKAKRGDRDGDGRDRVDRGHRREVVGLIEPGEHRHQREGKPMGGDVGAGDQRDVSTETRGCHPEYAATA